MEKLVYLKKSEWEKIAQEFNKYDLPQVTELSTDESIDERAKKHYNKPYDVNGIDITPVFNEGYRHGATEQSLIEQMKAKKCSCGKEYTVTHYCNICDNDD